MGAFGDVAVSSKPGGALTMRSPWHALLLRCVDEERRLGRDLDLCAAVLTLGRCFHFSVEEIGGELHPVADAKDGNAQLEDFP